MLKAEADGIPCLIPKAKPGNPKEGKESYGKNIAFKFAFFAVFVLLHL